MTLLGGAVYAGFFALAALWLVATNPDTAEEGAQPNAADGSSADNAAPCCAGSSSLN